MLMVVLPQEEVRNPDSLLVVFWNVENFFDWTAEGTSSSEQEFSSDGKRRWTRGRFYAKCNAVAKTILLMAHEFGRIPDAVALAEIENSFVLKQLASSTVLRKLGYRAVHYDSPDLRGIDCGLLYRSSVLHLVSSEPKHVYGSKGEVLATRDILLADFGSFVLLVNHHPSKLGGGESDRRIPAMRRMNQVMDSLKGRSVLSVGDFNDDLWNSDGIGTIRYDGRWEKIDGHFSRDILRVDEYVFDSPALSVPDSKYGGSKPRRTYSGLRYLGGVSDHYPIALLLYL